MEWRNGGGLAGFVGYRVVRCGDGGRGLGGVVWGRSWGLKDLSELCAGETLSARPCCVSTSFSVKLHVSYRLR